MASLLSSMPPSTDCSAATSCGGCRLYSGAVAAGRLKSSATATVVPPSTHRRIREQAPADRPGPGGGSTRNAYTRREPVFGSLLPPGTDTSCRQRGWGGREEERTDQSNTHVHLVLHNLWTSRWTH